MLFYEKYLELCRAANKTPSAAGLEMGISKATVSRWKNGGGVTDVNKLRIAEYFGVPVSELTGEKGEKNEPPAKGGEPHVSAARLALIESLDGLTDDQLIKLTGIIKEAKKLL